MSGTVTVITVSMNAVSTVEDAIRSVITQSYPKLEYIVVDGGSKDGSAELIGTYTEKLAWWVSEPDSGIADAMNKGLSKATGQYVLYLNADDYLIGPHSIEWIARFLDGDIIGGPIIKCEPDGCERLVKPRGFNWWLNFKTGLFHQGTLCSREMLEELGGFDTRLGLSMDYDLFLRAYRRGYGVRLLNAPFSVMRSGGVSTRSDMATLRRRLAEEEAIHFRNCPTIAMRLAYTLYWSVYPAYRMLRGRYDRYRVGY